MRAPLVAVITAVGAAALAGCGDSGATPLSTGLVVGLHFDHDNVDQVALSGSTFTTSRRFGPYLVDEASLTRDSTVGFVFDPSDAGTAMVCGEARDLSGRVLASGCDTFDVRSEQVMKGDLTLDSTTH